MPLCFTSSALVNSILYKFSAEEIILFGGIFLAVVLVLVILILVLVILVLLILVLVIHNKKPPIFVLLRQSAVIECPEF